MQIGSSKKKKKKKKAVINMATTWKSAQIY